MRVLSVAIKPKTNAITHPRSTSWLTNKKTIKLSEADHSKASFYFQRIACSLLRGGKLVSRPVPFIDGWGLSFHWFHQSSHQMRHSTQRSTSANDLTGPAVLSLPEIQWDVQEGVDHAGGSWTIALWAQLKKERLVLLWLKVRMTSMFKKTTGKTYKLVYYQSDSQRGKSELLSHCDISCIYRCSIWHLKLIFKTLTYKLTYTFPKSVLGVCTSCWWNWGYKGMCAQARQSGRCPT